MPFVTVWKFLVAAPGEWVLADGKQPTFKRNRRQFNERPSNTTREISDETPLCAKAAGGGSEHKAQLDSPKLS